MKCLACISLLSGRFRKLRSNIVFKFNEASQFILTDGLVNKLLSVCLDEREDECRVQLGPKSA